MPAVSRTMPTLEWLECSLCSTALDADRPHGLCHKCGGVLLAPALARMPGSVGDFGWGGMASTYFWTDPVKELTAVYFTQLVPSSSYPSRVELKALVHGALVG